MTVIAKNAKKKKKGSSLYSFKRNIPLHLMLLPALALLIIYSYGPMVGLKIAFEKFIPAKGLFGNQKFIGLNNFTYLLALPGAMRALRNTVVIAVWKIVLNLVVPIIVALLINEVRSARFRKIVQTVIYLPHFLSWIILSGILIDMLSPSTGLINKFLGLFGLGPYFFLGSNDLFQGTIIFTDIWKEFGYGTIVYLAAITSIDPSLYESATVDGANKLQQTWHITLPGMRMIIVLMMVLSLGNVLNAGFDQVFNLYSVSVYETGDIIDTFIYRIGLIDAQYGVATAMGLFKSLVSTVFVSVSYFAAYKFANYRIF